LGYLDAFAASAILKDSQGRMVFVVSRRRAKAYIVTPDAVKRLRQMIRGWFGLAMAAMVVSAIAFGIPMMVAVAGVLLLCYYAGLAYFTRGLELASEIPSVTRAEAVQKNMRAMGRGTIGFVAACGALFALLGVIVAVSGRGSWAWLLVAYGAAICVLYTRQWLRFEPSKRQPNEEL
jgi:hypothetical protein